MAKNSKITLPNGVVIEISSDFRPDQINAIITSVMGGGKFEESRTPVVEQRRSVSDIWQSSKKERVALFVRNFFSPTLWFSAKELLEEQLQIARVLTFGETSQIGTYLKRLYEERYLDRQTNGRLVKYRITDKLLDEYPQIELAEISELILNSI